MRSELNNFQPLLILEGAFLLPQKPAKPKKASVAAPGIGLEV
jgi:hypothetical protein